MRVDYYEIISGSFFLILTTVVYLLYPSLNLIPFIFASLTFIIIGIFEFKKYYNIYVYTAVVAVILLVMWLFNFIQPLSPDADISSYYFAAVMGMLLIFNPFI